MRKYKMNSRAYALSSLRTLSSFFTRDGRSRVATREQRAASSVELSATASEPGSRLRLATAQLLRAAPCYVLYRAPTA